MLAVSTVAALKGNNNPYSSAAACPNNVDNFVIKQSMINPTTGWRGQVCTAWRKPGDLDGV
jgi:hypothetical protein